MFLNYFHQLASYKKRDTIHFVNENGFQLGKSHFRTLHEAMVGGGEREPFFGKTSPSRSPFRDGLDAETTVWHHTQPYQLVQAALFIDHGVLPL